MRGGVSIRSPSRRPGRAWGDPSSHVCLAATCFSLAGRPSPGPVGEYDPGFTHLSTPARVGSLADEVSVKLLSPFWVMAFVR